LFCLLTFLSGCYASREPIASADAFEQPDAGPDAIDAPPDAVVPNLGLGADCSLGGTANSFALLGRASLTQRRDWREASSDGWWVEAVPELGAFNIFTGGDSNWFFRFGAGPASELIPAEFVDAVGSDGPAVLYVAGAGRGGTDTSGRFTVHEVTLRGEELVRLRASFTFVDRSVSVRGEEITGCIRYVAP
jgi:hypothetical protein